MRIEGIQIHNYRQYGDVDIEFPQKDKDLQIIVGRNGVGKTTFLNAINWCLYGDEPHAYSKESSLPIPNLNSANENDVFVKLRVRSDDGALIIFTRKLGFALEVLIMYNSGESQVYHGAEADMYVDYFVPHAIREFFFFDGERLDTYFLNEKTKNIKRRISILSHVDILETMDVELTKKYNQIKRKASDKSSDIEDIYLKLEEKQKTLDEEKERAKRLEDKIQKNDEILENLKADLSGIPDVEKLERERNRAKSDKERAEQRIAEIDNERRELFLFNSPYLFLNSALDYVIDDVKSKKENDELPKPVDDKIIQESLDNHVCHICGRPLDEESYNRLYTSLADYNISSDESKFLLDLDSKTKVNKTIVNNYESTQKRLIKSYKNAQEDYKRCSEKFSEVDKQFLQYNDDQIKEKHRERKALEESIDDDRETLISCKANIKVIKRDMDRLDTDLTAAMEKNEKTKILRQKKIFLEDAVALVKTTKEQIIEDTKDDIEDFTRESFFDLIWKKDTFSDVIIDDSYQVQLIHSITGQNSLGSASAAERELLVLAFTLGVHSISEFNSSLLIDTPLARVSDEHRINFAKVLLEISRDKQIILLFTPAEFSSDIQELLEDEDILKYEIAMDETEKSSDIKEMI